MTNFKPTLTIFCCLLFCYINPCFADKTKCADYANTCWVDYNFIHSLTVGIYNMQPIQSGMLSYSGIGPNSGGGGTVFGQCTENTDDTVTITFTSPGNHPNSITLQSSGLFMKVTQLDLFNFGSYINPTTLSQAPLHSCGI